MDKPVTEEKVITSLKKIVVPTLIKPFDDFEYHTHQKDAITWMIQRESDSATYFKGGILADEMGLGKTWMTIGLLLTKPVDHTLILVPPVLQHQWTAAFEQSNISYTLLGPTCRKSTNTYKKEYKGTQKGIHVTITTYDRASNNIHLLLFETYDRIICDEGHILRNGMYSKRYTNIIKINANKRWILSGTPIQNKKSDFSNLLRFLGINREIYMKTPLDLIASQIMLRRIVSDVSDVVHTMPTIKPSHIIHPVYYPVDSEEEKVFNSLVGRYTHAIEENASSTIILELYLRIRQFIAHPAIYVNAMRRKYKYTYKRTQWDYSTSKYDKFQELLTSLPTKPTIVFGTFRDELDLAEVALCKAGYKVWSIRGGISEIMREKAVIESKFKSESTNAIALVVQIIAGSAGLNLQHCSRIFFLSSHWNPAIVDQAIARAYRMGQTNMVEVHHLLLGDDAERNIDRYMAKLHESKREIAISIHPKLYCDSAIDHEVLTDSLQAASLFDD